MKDWVSRIRVLSIELAPAQGAGPWGPAADVYRTSEGWMVKFELAGVRPEDIAVRVEGRRLTLSGMRRDWCSVEGRSIYSMEISYNRFQRSIEFPCELSGAAVSLEYREGMLLVQLLCGGER